MGAGRWADAQDIIAATSASSRLQVYWDWGGDAVHWTEPTETMAKTIAETQKQIWKHWCDLIPGVPSPTPFIGVPQAGQVKKLPRDSRRGLQRARKLSKMSPTGC